MLTRWLLASLVLANPILAIVLSYQVGSTSPLIAYNPPPRLNGSSPFDIDPLFNGMSTATYKAYDVAPIPEGLANSSWLFTRTPGQSSRFGYPTYANTSMAGASVTFDFVGTGVQLYGHVPTNAEVDAVIDGQLYTNLSRATTSFSEILRTPELPFGRHTVEYTLRAGNLVFQRATILQNRRVIEKDWGYEYRFAQSKDPRVVLSGFREGKLEPSVQNGTWTSNTTTYRLETSEEHATFAFKPSANSSSILIEGFNIGTYRVSCKPEPLHGNSDFVTYAGHTALDNVALYQALLDPTVEYEITLQNLANSSTAIYRTKANVYTFASEKEAKNIKKALAIGLPVSLGTISLLGGLIWWISRRRRRRAQTRPLVYPLEQRITPPTAGRITPRPVVPESIDESDSKSVDAPEGLVPVFADDDDGTDASCVVCLSGQAVLAVSECGHLCMCRPCASRIVESVPPKCPVCNQEIKKPLIRIYRP